MSESILIVGSGAMACLFAARLAASGQAVSILGTWQPALEVLAARGVTLIDPLERTTRTFRVEVLHPPIDHHFVHSALILVKTWQTPRVADQLMQVLSGDGLALTLQNGLGNYETLVETLGIQRVAIGTTTWAAATLQPGIVQLNGIGDLVIGDRPGLEGIIQILEKAGFPVQRSAEIQTLLWRKLVTNAAINPLTALLDIPNGDLLRLPAARLLMKRLVEEAVRVGCALGYPFTLEEMIASVEDVAQKTAANESSMLQDFHRGAPTEIEAITGALLGLAGQTGIDVPVHRALYQMVNAKLESSGILSS